MRIELGYTEKMGPKLRTEVERQLLEDLRFYHPNFKEAVFDWSGTCPEGHVTRYLDGLLENWSGVALKDFQGNYFTNGWINFIHGEGKNPLFVFWDLLSINMDNKIIPVKNAFGIPGHIWNKLPAKSKELCANSKGYDSYWRNDPLVVKGDK